MGLRFVQRDAHRQVIDLLDRLDELREAHVVEVVVVGAGDFEERVVFLALALEREDHVVGVEVARRLERAGVVPLHALAQRERVDLAVGGDVPLFGETRHDLGAAALEFDEAVVDRLGGVERGTRRVHAGVEVLGAAFGTEHQRLGAGARRGRQGQRGDREMFAMNKLHKTPCGINVVRLLAFSQGGLHYQQRRLGGNPKKGSRRRSGRRRSCRRRDAAAAFPPCSAPPRTGTGSKRRNRSAD
jgi:hypothetical protein